ncbi:MAG: oxidoreductase [Salinivirgaceae bacterium]|jgi:NAD(P)-dependent dehydrogenase (short-subunit alcohol dehydrogenase family)|nr:oxidoreductase [Salinivirgaceae bacterium]
MAFNINNISTQNGRIAIVTGANVGLGYETTLALAKTGMKVVMACRNLQKAQIATEEIRQQIASADLEVMQLDLSSLKSVREFAETYIDRYDRLDLLINNAGIMIPPFTKTGDGFESQMGVNYFSHFLLTNLLFPVIAKTKDSRIVSLSSIAHERGVIDFDNLHAEKGYSKMKAYQQSKLACLIFAIELQRRIEASGSNVISVAAHPGVSNTNLGRHIPKLLVALIMPIFSFFTHKPEKAALPTLMAALDDNVKGGDYFGPTGYKGMKGKPGKVEPKPHAFDTEVAKKLWTVSEELTGKTFSLK